MQVKQIFKVSVHVLLAVCDWGHMPTIFVTVKFPYSLCLKYNKVPLPYLKHTGSVTKIKLAKIAF